MCSVATLAFSTAHASLTFDSTNTGSPAGQLQTGTGNPPVYVYGFQYYVGSSTDTVSDISFELNAQNGRAEDLVFGTVWNYSSGTMIQVATSTNSYNGLSFNGSLTNPSPAHFTFSPPVALQANGTYFVAIQPTNTSPQATHFVLYGNTDKELMPSNDFASCSKYSGTDLKITGSLAYIDSTGNVGWKSCGSLVGATVSGQASPLGIVKPETIARARAQAQYTQPIVVGHALSSNGQASAGYNDHSSTGVDTSVPANQTPGLTNENPNSTDYQLAVPCDGPSQFAKNADGSAKTVNGHAYVSCDFVAFMAQVQHIINALIVFGVFVALGGFIYAGYLFINGKESDRKKGYDILPKVFGGFIIMLSAWFIVQQIINWLGSNVAGFTTLIK